MTFNRKSNEWKLNQILLPQGFIFSSIPIYEMEKISLEEYVIVKKEEKDEFWEDNDLIFDTEIETTDLGRIKNSDRLMSIEFDSNFIDQGSKFHLLRNVFKIFDIKNISNKFLKNYVKQMNETFFLERVEFLLYEKKFTKFLNFSNLDKE